MNGIVLDPIIPIPWIALLGAGFLAATLWVYFTAGARLPRWRNALLATSRLAAIALVLLALLQPSRREETPVPRAHNVLLVGIDGSRSMLQTDAPGNISRLQAAKDMVQESGLLSPAGNLTVKFFKFGGGASPVQAESLNGIKADEPTTDFYHSVQTMVDSVTDGETIKGLVLLTDGHDLELSSPARTAFAARSRFAPIYAAPLGAEGYVRDASLRITNFQPYYFVHQKAHISATIRLIGCEHEDITVQLLRQGEAVQTTTLNAGEQDELPVDFEVAEKNPGQYEYQVRVVPLAHEADVNNNSAVTYLNVINQQTSVLLLEGAPYWDTTFLSRSLFANAKISLDAIFAYMPDKMRRIRKVEGIDALQVPRTRQDFERYDVVILGRDVDKMLGHEQIAALGEYVRDHGGTVIFSRGKAYEPPDDLDPVTWSDAGNTDVHLGAGRQAGSLPVFRALADGVPGGLDSMPKLLGVRRIADRKALAAIVGEASAAGGGDKTAFPAIIHRRYGRGQVLSVAVDGLWRWSLNAKSTATNNLFDRFWDQLIVWLVSNSDFIPSQKYSFRASTANLALGEKISLRLASRDEGRGAALSELPVTLYCNDQPIVRTSLAPAPDAPGVLHADYQPEKAGLYRATISLPDGGTQEVRWMVYEDNPEDKEVAADVPYLKALCESSGGKVLAPGELKSTVEQLNQPEASLRPKVKLTSVWDRAWVFYVLCGALALDWFLRRKWGLC